MGDSSMPAPMLTNDRLLSWRKQSLAALRAWFPGAVIWFGDRTGHWWAMVPAGLVEGASPDELGRKLSSFEVTVSLPGWREQEALSGSGRAGVRGA